MGISSGRLPALDEKISMYDAKVKRDLLRDGARPPSICIKKQNMGRRKKKKNTVNTKSQ